MKLKVFEVLNDKQRISSIDVFRCLAIVPVVLYHFDHYLPYGYLGVDLFFVISGFLVGSILIKKFKADKRIGFAEFVLQRGFKIWPSYYSFLIVGSLLAVLFYRGNADQFIIPLNEYPKYLFFYQNYGGGDPHWIFDHVWSLCIEEHFYILLPLFIIIIKAISAKNIRLLTAGVIGLILMGVFFKFASVFLTGSKGTYAETHNRIDSLSWGVLLGIIIMYHGEKFRTLAIRKYLFMLGLILLAGNVFINSWADSYMWNKVVFHSMIPFCFFLMIAGSYYYDFSALKPIRFIAYFSYNWYLWHPIFVWVIIWWVGFNIWGVILYLIVSFGVATLFTILVEEKFLKLREPILDRIFNRKKKVALAS